MRPLHKRIVRVLGGLTVLFGLILVFILMTREFTDFEVISALWITVATVTGGWLVVELLSERRARDRRARGDSRAISKSGDRRHQPYGRREDDNV